MSVAATTFRGLGALELRHPSGARATVLLDGAHVVSFVPAAGDEVLFLSRDAKFATGTTVRGGIPVIFPQFADRGPLPKHGFARTTRWQPVAEPAPDDSARAILRLDADAATRALWPASFRAELVVELLERALDVTLTVWNRGDAPFTFTAALHTYFAVSDVRAATLRGLAGTRYESRATGEPEGVETRDPVAVAGEVDRVYLGAPPQLVLHDGARTIAIAQRGFVDAVLWNPGPEKARALPDLADDEWTRMLCIEAATIEHPVTLAPRAAWTGAQTLVAI